MCIVENNFEFILNDSSEEKYAKITLKKINLCKSILIHDSVYRIQRTYDRVMAMPINQRYQLFLITMTADVKDRSFLYIVVNFVRVL